MCPTRAPLRPITVLFVLGIFVGGLIASGETHAQSPPAECASGTETNASVILPPDLTLHVNGASLESPLYISVYTPDGQCAGVARWTGDATVLTVWGAEDRPAVPSSPAAFRSGDSLHVRVFNPATNVEYKASNSRISVSFRSDQSHFTTTAHYVPDGIYALDQIRVDSAGDAGR